jgi:hypothetical protein
MKNPPFVSYPVSNKVLPRVFRTKSGVEEENHHFKRTRHISELNFEEKDDKLAPK